MLLDPRGVRMVDPPGLAPRRPPSGIWTRVIGILTGQHVWRLRMIEEISAGTLCPGLVILGDSRDEPCLLEHVERVEDSAPSSSRFRRERLDRGEAGESLVGLVGKEDEDELHRRCADVTISRPVKGFPAHRSLGVGAEAHVKLACPARLRRARGVDRIDCFRRSSCVSRR